MLENLNKFLEHWEPLWLCAILFYEGLIGSLTLWILVKEWFYDKEIEERKYKRRLKRAKERWENE